MPVCSCFGFSCYCIFGIQNAWLTPVSGPHPPKSLTDSRSQVGKELTHTLPLGHALHKSPAQCPKSSVVLTPRDPTYTQVHIHILGGPLSLSLGSAYWLFLLFSWHTTAKLFEISIVSGLWDAELTGSWPFLGGSRIWAGLGEKQGMIREDWKCVAYPLNLKGRERSWR